MTTPTTSNERPGDDDSLLLCVSDLEHSAIYDSHAEMQACIRAVAERLKALALRAQAAPTAAAGGDGLAGLHGFLLSCAAKADNSRDAQVIRDWAREITALATPPAAAPAVTAPSEAVPDQAARKLYNSFTDNHPTIHCNRFASWAELGEAERNTWRRKAKSAALQTTKPQDGSKQGEKP